MKKLLAFSLCFCLIFQCPAQAFAADLFTDQELENYLDDPQAAERVGVDYEEDPLEINSDSAVDADEVVIDINELPIVEDLSLAADDSQTTETQSYSLSYSIDETKTTYNSVRIIMQVLAEPGIADVIYGVFKLDSGAEFRVEFTSSSSYKKPITLMGLYASKTYSITHARLYLQEGGKSVTVYNQDISDLSFTTLDAVIPNAITLNQSDIILNLNSNKTSTISVAKIEPADGATEVKYTNSDNSVISIDSKGKITALRAGTATVGVTSIYNSKLTTTCTVTVKDYALGYYNASGTFVNVENKTIACYKKQGEKITLEDKVRMFEKIDGKYTEIADAQRTSNRDSIISISNGKIKVNGYGQAPISFEYGGLTLTTTYNVKSVKSDFKITGLSNSTYPAVEDADSYIIAKGYDYKLSGVLYPVGDSFSAKDFTFTSSDQTVATVNTSGQISAISPGTATITLTPNDTQAYNTEAQSIVIKVKALPEAPNPGKLYALANVCQTLGQINLNLSNWEWTEQSKKLPIINTNDTSSPYYFEAQYTGSDFYPMISEIPVYLGKITGYKPSVSNGGKIKADGTDFCTIIDYSCLTKQGRISTATYSYDFIDVPSGLKVENHKDESGSVTGVDIFASSPGTYTLERAVLAGGKILYKGKIKITAVDYDVPSTISLSALIDKKEVPVDDKTGLIKAYNFEDYTPLQQIKVTATLKNKAGSAISPTAKLKWLSSDSSVAKIAADPSDSTGSSAIITCLDEGNVSITVKTTDGSNCSEKYSLQIRNYKPRVDSLNPTINLAYDYQSEEINEVATNNNSTIEIVPVYDTQSISIKLFSDEACTKEFNDILLNNIEGYRYLLVPAKADSSLSGGTFFLKADILVDGVTSSYVYPLSITIIDQAPTVKLTQTTTPNLFYTDSAFTFKYTGDNLPDIAKVAWSATDLSATAYQDADKKGNIINCIRLDQTSADQPSLTGTLAITFAGYKVPSTVNLTLKSSYKKPAIVSKGSASSISKIIGACSNTFSLYDKSLKADVNEITNISCDNADITVTSLSSSVIQYTVTDNFIAGKQSFKVKAKNWREEIVISHTISDIVPSLSLSQSKITINSAYPTSKVSTKLSVKSNCFNSGESTFLDISVSGADEKAQALINNGSIDFRSEATGYVYISGNSSALFNKEIASGSYKFLVAPTVYYKDSGKVAKLSGTNLTIVVTNKPITAKVTTKGRPDLTAYRQYMNLTTKFSNIGSGYRIKSITDVKIKGEYARYFKLTTTSSSISSADTTNNNPEYRLYEAYFGKLRTNASYKLYLEYTLTNDTGETITVTSNTFTVKPVQTTTPITIASSNLVLYSSRPELTRTVPIIVSSDYTVTSASGALDCNKDGDADVLVTSDGTSITVQISDENSVSATATGKKLTIPVSFRLKGTDGIVKEKIVKINVTIKK